jgi:WD40 repeat protein
MSPDGKLLAVTGGKTDAGNVRVKIFVYDTETWKRKATMTVDGPALELRFSPDGKSLAAACGRLWPNEGKSDGDVRLWEVADLLAGKN